MDSNSSTVTTYAVTLVTTGVMNTAAACLPTSNTSNREYQLITIQHISDGTHIIVHQWKDRDSINISVRAHDIVNNTLVASRLGSFDSSAPYSSEAIFFKKYRQ